MKMFVDVGVEVAWMWKLKWKQKYTRLMGSSGRGSCLRRVVRCVWCVVVEWSGSVNNDRNKTSNKSNKIEQEQVHKQGTTMEKRARSEL